MAALGLNLMLPRSTIRVGSRRTAAASRWRVRTAWSCIVWDHRFQGLDSDSAHDVALIPPIVADYRGEPGLSAYYFGDEPSDRELLALERFAARLRSFDPAHPIWNNLSGRAAFPTREAWLAHHRAYVARIHPAVLCNDQYDFLRGTDRGQFVENAAGLNAVAREAGIPFWGIIQLIEHGPFRSPTAGELRWQIGMLLAYGARGVGYFTYWTPRPDPRLNWQPAVLTLEGQRTAWYPVLARLGAYLRPLGEALAGMTWMATVHAGSVPLGGTAFSARRLGARRRGTHSTRLLRRRRRPSLPLRREQRLARRPHDHADASHDARARVSTRGRAIVGRGPRDRAGAGSSRRGAARGRRLRPGPARGPSRERDRRRRAAGARGRAQPGARRGVARGVAAR